VVIAGGVYGVAGLLAGSPGNGTSASKGAPVAGPAEAPVSPGRRAPAAGSGAADSGAGAAARIVSSGTNYRSSQLKSQVSAVLAQYHASATEGPGPSPAHQPAGAFRQWPACVPRVTGGALPLLVDHASYQGRPATVIVVPAGRTGELRVLVVAGACTATTGRVLAMTTLPGSG
jgi:hypothetical protein